MRLRLHCAIACLALGLLGCEATESNPLLQVDVKTDYVPGEDFDSIRVEIGRGDLRVNLEHIVDLGGDYVRGRRVGSGQVSEGDIDVVARMIQNGTVVASRDVIVTVSGDVTAATIIITRNCGSVECPAVGGDAVLRSCYGGRCADPRCTVETPELCPTLCASDADCNPNGCREGQCLEGACFSVPNDAACANGESCRGDGVCVPGGQDGGPRLDGGFLDGGCAGTEVCNGRDDDCDGITDEDLNAVEVCNGVDDDCDGIADEDVVVRDDICNGADDDCDGTIDEGVDEVCNGLDDDCDSRFDENLVCDDCTSWNSGARSYLLCPGRASWGDAMTDCASRGLNSVSIEDEVENSELAARLSGSAWLGLNDRDAEGEFVWENGSASGYRNWAGAEPNDEGGGEDCVALERGGEWNDVPCANTYMVLCESR